MLATEPAEEDLEAVRRVLDRERVSYWGEELVVLTKVGRYVAGRASREDVVLLLDKLLAVEREGRAARGVGVRR